MKMWYTARVSTLSTCCKFSATIHTKLRLCMNKVDADPFSQRLLLAIELSINQSVISREVKILMVMPLLRSNEAGSYD